jgi:poly-gamma-glutamate synthesis protein (capsule biosynthesis protein)
VAAAGGDLLGYYQPVTAIADPDLQAVSKLFRGADIGFANREGNVFDLSTFKGAPGAETGGFDQMGVGGGPLASAATAADMKAFGLGMLSLANNHAGDWGPDGILETVRVLDEAGVAHAGVGSGRAAARAAGFAETAKGRVALIATTSTYLPAHVAGPGDGERRPRPGVSALRNQPVTLVDAEEFRAVKAIAARQGHMTSGDEVELAPNSDVFKAQRFRRSDRQGLDYEVNADDRKEILDAVRRGKAQADFAAFSIHAHETESGGQEHEAAPESLTPAPFLQPLFHAAIDAGADIVLAHGPHTLRGIEIYRGKPIFYGLGSLFFDIKIPGYDWPSAWYDSVVALSTFKGGRVSEIRLYPIVLRQGGRDAPRGIAGAPRLATGADARRILAELQRQSAPYGTRIDIQGNVGVVRPQPTL